MTASVLPQLKSIAFELGFDLCAVTVPVIPEKEKSAFVSWTSDGLHAGMAYMAREPERRLNPTTAFPEAKSLLTLGVSYYQGAFPPKPGPAYGRVARYAWGLDYHDVITARLEKFSLELQNIFGAGVRAWPAVDSKPVLERALADKSGLGFVGKNTVLIAPGASGRFHVGSWIFLTELFLNVELEGAQEPKIKDSCGACTKCLTSCPTDAFERPYRLKADKCISYLTIENKGEIPLEMRAPMGDWLFGCDICQDVCPFNARAYEARWPEFSPKFGAGAWISLKEIMELPEGPAFKQKFGATPLSRAKRKGLIRNACVVAGNSGDKSLKPTLEKLLKDSEPLISAHARWALGQLS